LRLQPAEAVYFKINVKKPGLSATPLQSELDLTYNER
jgi:glucose-6-phosphate 1-dehydrogenase